MGNQKSLLMGKYFFSFFNIVAGEGKSTALFALLAFLWAFAVTSAQKFGDALFLQNIGAEGLPLTYQLSAAGLILLAIGLMYAFDSIPIHKIYMGLLSGTAGFYCIINLYIHHFASPETTWTWYAIRVCGTVIFAISVTCYWSFIDHFHDKHEAKRLYSLFSSSIFIGIISTGSLMNSGWITLHTLSILVATLLALTIGIIWYIERTVEHVHHEDDRIGAGAHNALPWREQLKTVITSRFTLLMISCNFMTYILLVITEYSYLSSFQSLFSAGTNLNGDSTPLSEFLGQWIAVSNVINLFIGLFLYSRVLQRFGLGSLILCTPLFLLITFSGWATSDALVFPIFGLFIVEGMLLVIDDSNFNLLLNEVPVKIKYKLRLAIESCFEPLGMFVSSLMLSLPHVNSKMLGLILSGLFLVIALLLRRHMGVRKTKRKEALLATVAMTH